MSNYINNIEIKNFKSVRHQTIDGCKRINVFIGYPNVGKSNILEAIGSTSFFQYIFKKGNFKLGDIIRLESASNLFFEGDVKNSATVTINQDSYFDYAYDKATNTFNFTLLFHERHTNRLLDRFDLVFNNDYSINRNSLLAAISKLQNISKERDISVFLANAYKLPKVFKYQFKDSVETDNDYTTSLMFPFGENLMRILSEDAELRGEIAELFDRYNLKIALDKTSDSIKIIKENKDGTIFILPYSLIADTLQRLIFYKTAIASNKESVILFEEPEAHMFPPYVSKFTGDIIHDENKNQYFLTTHSPFVLNDFMEDAREDLSVYVVGYKNGETTIKRLSDEELHEIYQYGVDLFFNLESYLA